MNDIFNLKRFGAYLRYDFIQNRQNYGITLLVLGLMPVAIYFIWGLFSLLIGHQWAPPSPTARWVYFACMTMVLLISYPARAYGYITHRQAGANLLLLPVSVTEKYISMLLYSLVFVPLVYMLLYFGSDGLLSLIDPNYGEAMLKFQPFVYFNQEWQEAMTNPDAQLITEIKLPFFMLTGTISFTLWFLLGGMIFRKHKIALSIVAMIVLEMAYSMILSPFIMNQVQTMEQLDEMGQAKQSMAEWMNNFIIIGYVQNTVLLLALLSLIYWRLRTIKH